MIIDAFIPARGGSKGIPKKNLINFLGKPLIVHSINYAKNCNLISNIYVSTDNEEISNEAKLNGAKVINRPKELADDSATTESAIEHYLQNIDYIPDLIVLLQPTSPHRPANSLELSINKLIENNYDSLLSISPTHKFFWNVHNDIAKPLYDYKNRPRRQDLNSKNINFVENGSLYLFTSDLFLKEKNRLGGKIGSIIFDEQFSVEIDTPNDLHILRVICSNKL